MLAELSFPHASYLIQDVSVANIRLASLVYFSLVYVSTYCVPIAHLRQNKPFRLHYLGHAQKKAPARSLFCRNLDEKHLFFNYYYYYFA